jgi:hypothetical protein
MQGTYTPKLEMKVKRKSKIQKIQNNQKQLKSQNNKKVVVYSHFGDSNLK